MTVPQEPPLQARKTDRENWRIHPTKIKNRIPTIPHLSLDQNRKTGLGSGLTQSSSRIQISSTRHRHGRSSSRTSRSLDSLGDIELALLLDTGQISRLGLALAVIQVSEHVHSTSLLANGFLNEFARTLVTEEGGPEGGLEIRLVVWTHDLFDIFGGLTCVVEWDGGDEVVADVCANDIVEEVGIDEAKVTINGGSGSTGEGPGLVVVVGHATIGVLEEGDCNYMIWLVFFHGLSLDRKEDVLTNPVVHPQPWDSPAHDHVEMSKGLASNDQSSNHDSNGDIRQDNQWQLVLLVEDTVFAKVEMRDLHATGSIISLSSNVHQEIRRPTEQLMDDIVPQSSHWRILGQFCELDQVCLCILSKFVLEPLCSCVWHECSILLHISRSLVVLRVRESPGMERNQEEGVHDQSHGIIQHLVSAKGTVSTFMCQNPDTCKDATSRKSICRPSSETEVCRGKHWDVGEGDVAEGSPIEKVAHDVGHGADDGGLEAMAGNGIVDFLHGEVWQFKDFAMEINVLSISWSALDLVGLCHGAGLFGGCLSSHDGVLAMWCDVVLEGEEV
ncbi:hypothetical protein HYFRA_00013481 [Hymenoscyphus fraxineus]|uniref:Uncharacterized protein n=1 Tax=Hymenoscyphus fraxineus TaxID=746836 RepID=A0A9N9PUX4_9HELO|nr:hypothetical protein HYFRA_00013481 [Hymenoscyphus fraxineus]